MQVDRLSQYTNRVDCRWFIGQYFIEPALASVFQFHTGLNLSRKITITHVERATQLTSPSFTDINRFLALSSLKPGGGLSQTSETNDTIVWNLFQNSQTNTIEFGEEGCHVFGMKPIRQNTRLGYLCRYTPASRCSRYQMPTPSSLHYLRQFERVNLWVTGISSPKIESTISRTMTHNSIQINYPCTLIPEIFATGDTGTKFDGTVY